MAIGFRGVGALAAGTSTPLTVALPTGHAEGDYIVLSMVVDATLGSTITCTTGDPDYAQLAALLNTTPTPDQQHTALSKFEGASEADASVEASAGATNGFFGFASNYTGVDTSTPLDGVAPVTSQSAGASEFTPTGLTTVTANAWAVSLVATPNLNSLDLKVGSEQSFTQRLGGASGESSTGSDVSVGLATKAIVAPGAVTFPTWEASASVSWTAISFVLRESGAATGQPTLRRFSHIPHAIAGSNPFRRRI